MKDTKQPNPNADYQREYRKTLTDEQKEKRRKYERAYRKNKPEYSLSRVSYRESWYCENKDKLAEWRKEYYNTNLKARKNHKIRAWLGRALKRQGIKSKSSWIKNVGCTKDEFIAHIESLFVEGMTWDNWTRDGWHIDHIIPLTKEGTNHYTNLQPLWAKDNLSKSNKLI
tara:strand:- start:11 stop:520 length:510 start_codon:yes stop_codon:yes gene_type:complete